MTVRFLAFIIIFFSCSSSNDLSNNPDCWKGAKGSCMEEKRINSGNIRSVNIGGTGN